MATKRAVTFLVGVTLVMLFSSTLFVLDSMALPARAAMSDQSTPPNKETSTPHPVRSVTPTAPPAGTATPTRTPTPTLRPATATPTWTVAPTWTPTPVVSPYDVNGDGVVTVLDIIIVAQQWQANQGDALLFDFNGNNLIDVGDLLIVAAHLSS
jgi:hypothetical protein